MYPPWGSACALIVPAPHICVVGVVVLALFRWIFPARRKTDVKIEVLQRVTHLIYAELTLRICHVSSVQPLERLVKYLS